MTQTPPEDLSPEEQETQQDESAEQGPPMIYPGERLTSGMTLAVLMPGDNKESYFKSEFTGELQPDEDPEVLAARVITVVRETCIGQLDDAIDAVAEYQQQLADSGRLPQ